MALTKAQRARLDKLATYLEGLPEDYKHFEMADFFGLENTDEALLRYARHNGGVPSCGTVACAVGHGPAAGVLVPPRMVSDGYVNWGWYSDLFGDGAVFDFCFAGGWSHIDNHHWGAAARIRLVLDQGVPKWKSWQEAVARYAPYRIDAKAKADA